MEMQKIGSWAFIIGVIIALIVGILGAGVFGAGIANWIPLVFVILGIIIGLLNVKDKEIVNFLVATIALLAVGAVQWGLVPVIGNWLGGIFAGIATLMAPAAVIVAIKTVWNIAKE